MIDVRNVSVRAGEFMLTDLCMTVPENTYGVLMGRTGCGKSTLLEAVAGLKRVTAGKILLSGEDVTHRKPALRGIGYVPQDAALFSTMTVAENLAFALDIRRATRAQKQERVEELAELMGIGDLLHRRPANLSGGERQRVALGRAISFRPRILLLDEPLSAIDEDTREDMHALLKSVQSVTRVTVLHVTHHRGEADRLADIIFRMEDGKVVEVEAPGA